MASHKRNALDRLLIGWLIGFIVPIIIFLVAYDLKFSDMVFADYLRNIWQMRIFMQILSLCAFPNLGFFFLFYRMKYDMAARGVILATFMYAFAVLVVKLI
jgi:hypothetical protein